MPLCGTDSYCCACYHLPLTTHLLGTKTCTCCWPHLPLPAFQHPCSAVICCTSQSYPFHGASPGLINELSQECSSVCMTPASQATTAVSIHLCACVRDTSLDVWCSSYTCWCVSLPTCQWVSWCSGSVCLCGAGFLWQMDWTRLDWSDPCTGEEWFRLLWPGSDRKPLSQVALGPTWYKY